MQIPVRCCPPPTQATSGLAGGCTGAPGAPLGFVAFTGGGRVEIPYTFDEPGDYGVCYRINASTSPEEHGSLPEHYLAWSSRIRVQYPVRTLTGGQTEIDTFTSLPLTLVLGAPFVGASVYPLNSDLIRLVPDSGGNCTLAINST